MSPICLRAGSPPKAERVARAALFQEERRIQKRRPGTYALGGFLLSGCSAQDRWGSGFALEKASGVQYGVESQQLCADRYKHRRTLDGVTHILLHLVILLRCESAYEPDAKL